VRRCACAIAPLDPRCVVRLQPAAAALRYGADQHGSGRQPDGLVSHRDSYEEVPPALADEEFPLLAPKNDRPAAAAGGPAVFSRGGCLLLQVLSLWQLQAALLHERAQAATSDML
jgi:hypothetical protein